MKRKYFLLIIALIFGALVWYIAAYSVSKVRSNGGKMKIVASFYPMAEFARQVGGDKVEVSTLVKPGVEPHEYDPSPQDMVAAQQSRVFIYNGAGFETWAGKITGGLKSRGVVVVEASSGLPLISTEGASDPHVWLDPVLAAKQVDNIAAAFTAADPSGRSTYEANAAAYKRQLAALDASYRTGLQTCTRHEAVTSHEAFAYLAQRYGFAAVPVSGLSPEEEPSPQKLAQVASFARANGVKYIFFETLVSPKLSETIARESGAQTIVFNPLEGLTTDEQNQGQNYLTVQRQNLANLKTALDCK